jgi:FlgD Ig-like domain
MRKTGIMNTALMSLALLLVAPLSFAAKTSGTVSSGTTTGQVIIPSDYADLTCDSSIICKGTPIFDTIIVNCVDTSYSMKIVEGPGSISTELKNLQLFGYYSYTPIATGIINVKFLVTHRHVISGVPHIDSSYVRKQYFVRLNTPPSISDIWSKADGCDFGKERIFDLHATDAEGDSLWFVKISGPGTVNPVTGKVRYTPEGPGKYEIFVAVYDKCGGDTACIHDSVTVNSPPSIVTQDTTVYLCNPEQVCINVQARDPDSDSLSIWRVSGPGNFVRVSNDAGWTCFTPANVDSATYTFVYCVVDSCSPYFGQPECAADCATDTVLVTVIRNKPPVLVCQPQSFFTCVADTFCFAVPDYNDPEFGEVTYTVLSDNAYLNGDSICLPVSGSGIYDVKVVITDPCGASDTCVIPVTVDANRPPVVVSADPFSITLCAPEAVCFAVNADDPDFDLATVTTNIGTYDGATDRVCFTPTVDGVYEIITTATDSCGITDADTTVVTIDINNKPVVTGGDNSSITQCGTQQICIPFDVVDDNLASVIPSIGVWDAFSSQVCFTPDTAGTYLVRVVALDNCQSADTASLLVTVSKPPSPTINLGNDLVFDICEPGQTCLPVTVSGSNPVVTTNFGTYNPQTGQICFDATVSAELRLIATTTDSCGQTASDNIKISVRVNRAPVITHMRDTSIYLCYPTYVCLPLTITDPDGDLKTVTVNRGQYSNGQVCFIPYGAGTYEVIATATDSCGRRVVDTANVVVTTDQYVKLIVPKDTTVFACDRDTFCFPIGGIPANAIVSVNGINTWYNPQTQSVCFYVDCGVGNRITVTAKTPCNTFTGTFTVTVGCNRPPIVILPPDYSQSVCGATSVCVPVGIADYDGNLKSVVVTGGTYDAGTKKICFNASGAGSYTLGVTVTDSCGATDTDQITVTLTPNQPPVVTPATFDTSLQICNPFDRQQICMTLFASDPNANLVSVVTSRGTYDRATGQLCFNVEPGTNDYTIYLIATDACGLADTSIVNVHLIPGDFVNIQCPALPIEPAPLCAAGQVCVPLSIDGSNFSVTSTFGTFANGQICFNADTSGIYTSKIIATAPCNADTCIVQVKVVIQPPVEVFCPKDTTTFLCATDTICLPYTASASATSVRVTAPAYLSNGQVCVPVLQSGNQIIKIIASGACGADTCQFAVNATINTPPVVNAGRDTTLTACQLSQVCIPFTYSDVNNNGVQVTTSHGTIVGNTVCFTPPNFGQFTITLTATDACGATSTDQVILRVIQGVKADITCPGQTQYFTICAPQTVCVNLPITPVGASLTITPANATYDWGTQKLCLPVSQTGNIQVNVIASSQCGADTCGFPVRVDRFDPPNVTSPASIDTVMCLATPDTLCFPVTITGTAPTVTVKPAGYYSAGYVCVPVSQTSNFSVQIIASNSCGADTSSTQVKVTADAPPILHLPSDITYEFCPGDTQKICIDGIWGTDTRSAVTLSRTCGAGTYTAARADSGKICFLPDTAGVYEFCFGASDGCATTTESFFVTVNLKQNCDVCVTLSIESGSCTVVGVTKDVFLNVQTNERIGGFDILLSYDASVMAFNSATIVNSDIQGWEYFTYRTNSAGCGSSCPSGIVRLVGIAETNNGQRHPPDSTLSPNGRLARVTFLIANNQNLGDQFLPINFVWYDCGDNSFSDPTGNYLYIDGRIFSPGGTLVWDEADDVTYPNALRPLGLGATDACAAGGIKGQPLRCIDFINGGVCVIHPESIDARGDINLNEISYEIADAVLYSNYFIYGLGVFKINIGGQIAASDVNADGLTLSVADLVQLIRVIVGDAEPIPKLNPYADPATLSTVLNADGATVITDAVGEIGALHLVYRLTGDVALGDVRAGDAVSGMDVKWSTNGSELRVLVSDIGTDRVAAGEQNLISIAYTGDGSLDLLSSEMVDYQGRPYIVNAKAGGLPTTFALSQNYPNPFNPTTTISFALPNASEWRMMIFSVTGAVVREFNGQSPAGAQSVIWDGRTSDGTQSASGVYYYRLTAGQFTETKKMVLLK